LIIANTAKNTGSIGAFNRWELKRMTDPDVEFLTMRRVSFRLLPLLFLIYIFCWLDRSNISIAALQMNSELKFSSATFGFGAGIFFLSYSLFEVPSNLILARIGARRWLARIAITWGLLACSMMWVQTPLQFYTVRFLLGMAEAGFFPGVIYYLSLWFPGTYRARAISCIMIGIPLSQVVGAPLGGALLQLSGLGHLSGWQWLFLVEGLPSVLLGIVALVYLTDRPEDARWLSKVQREWVSNRIQQEPQQTVATHVSLLRTLGHPILWALIVPYFALCAIGYAATFWAPLLVRDALGTGNSATSLIVGGVYLLAALAYPLAGMLSDRIDDRCGLAALGLAFYCVGGIGVALLPHSIFRVMALVVLQIGNPIFMCSFWCVPSKLLKGASAAAGIALVSSIGTTGGFFGPSIVGFLKQTTGSDSGAFLGLAGLALLGAFVCIGLRRTTGLSPGRRLVGVGPTRQSA
jgi:ACS family tartrate transporter-like MFS transporter